MRPKQLTSNNYSSIINNISCNNTHITSCVTRRCDNAYTIINDKWVTLKTKQKNITQIHKL